MHLYWYLYLKVKYLYWYWYLRLYLSPCQKNNSESVIIYQQRNFCQSYYFLSATPLHKLSTYETMSCALCTIEYYLLSVFDFHSVHFSET